jgi:hypothetical protein
MVEVEVEVVEVVEVVPNLRTTLAGNMNGRSLVDRVTGEIM